MKVTNDSNAKISDDEIVEIVKRHVRINLYNKTSDIIITLGCDIVLAVDSGCDEGVPEFVRVGKLAKIECWGIDDEQ